MGSPVYLGKKAFNIFRRLNAQAPWCYHHRFLESWYNENVKDGSKAYRNRCTAAFNYLEKELRSYWTDIDEVVMGGSLGKGTVVKNQSDIDVFVFMDWATIDTVGSMRYRIQLKIGQNTAKNFLEEIDGVTGIWSDEFVIHFKLEHEGLNVSVDLLLTADNSHGGEHAMVEAMLRKIDTNREFYSACLVRERQQFIKSQPGYVKELIRLVKTWAHAALPKHLRKAYFFELLTIYLWEKAGNPIGFDKAQGLKDVLQNLANLRSIRVADWYGDDDEDTEEAILRLNMQTPIVLDPTNPTNNVCKFLRDSPNNMKTLSRAARATLLTAAQKDVTIYTNWGDH